MQECRRSAVALQVDVVALPDGPKNPYGNGFIPVETDLTTEKTAQRVCDPHKSRLWKIKNPNSLHPITGAKLCRCPGTIRAFECGL